MTSRTKERLVEFEALLEADVIDLQAFKAACGNGIPDKPGVRSTSWKILLDYLPPKRKFWEDVLRSRRAAYQGFIRDFIINTHHASLKGGEGNSSFVDPLGALDTGEQENKWDEYFKENEYLEQIDKDVKRLCPEFAFYRCSTTYPRPLDVEPLHQRVDRQTLQAETVALRAGGVPKVTRRSVSDEPPRVDGEECHWEVVERILFIYAKLNPGICYVQGMNELLGPLYYVMATDPREEWRRHAEADTFFCFTALMSVVRDNFIETLDNSENGIRALMARMLKTLQKHDVALFDSLEKKALKPQFFAFRWLTLMLSQEFSLPDVIRLWDSILASEDRLSYLIFVCIGMLQNVREQVLKGDFSETMKLLQNYPRDVDVLQVLAKADLVYQQELHEIRHKNFISK
eukprot:m.36063 g.36063  ORF g.36063 m.36063 type:complete len:402 (+) comp11372_c0_seq1:203-1408(+)